MLHIEKFDNVSELSDAIAVDDLAEKLHRMLIPFEDPVDEIIDGIRYAMDDSGYRGGYILAAMDSDELAGALVMLHTGMKGYVPENLLLYVAVDPEKRGKGIGTKLIERAIEECEGNIKLHVEYDNPAKRLYERIGFVSKYADMRYENE